MELIWVNEESNARSNKSVYTDRLLQWDRDKYNKYRKKHFGDTAQIWHRDDPKKIEDFLRDYFDCKSLFLMGIFEGYNQSNGNPISRFDYYNPIN